MQRDARRGAGSNNGGLICDRMSRCDERRTRRWGGDRVLSSSEGRNCPSPRCLRDVRPSRKEHLAVRSATRGATPGTSRTKRLIRHYSCQAVQFSGTAGTTPHQHQHQTNRMRTWTHHRLQMQVQVQLQLSSGFATYLPYYYMSYTHCPNSTHNPAESAPR